jgi:hypothetical protein
MLKRPIMPIATALALLAAAGWADAQQPPDCPTVEADRGIPVELRIGDLVLRAQVSSEVRDSAEGTRVEGRLIGCERAPADAMADDPSGDPSVQGLTGVLRLLHDLRVGLELGPTQEGRCVRARLDVTDGAGSLPGTSGDGPIALELCGLPLKR